jgi:hypothetical protein
MSNFLTACWRVSGGYEPGAGPVAAKAMMRLEDIRLPEAGETAALILPGRVEGIEFLAGMMRLRIDTPGRDMRVRMHRDPAREIGVDDEARLGCATTNMVVFPDGASA